MSAVGELTGRKRRRSTKKDTTKSKSMNTKLKSSTRSRSKKKKRIRSCNVDVDVEDDTTITTDERQLRRDRRLKDKRNMEKQRLEKTQDKEEDEKEQKELLEKKQKEIEMAKTQTELKSKLVNAQLYDCFSMATSDVKENIVLKLFAKLEQKEANDMLKSFIKSNSNSNSTEITTNDTDDKSSPWQKTFGLPGRAGIMQDIFEFVEDYERISVLPFVCRQWKVIEEKHHWKVLNISKRLTKIFENEPYRFSCCILLKLDKTTHLHYLLHQLTLPLN